MPETTHEFFRRGNDLYSTIPLRRLGAEFMIGKPLSCGIISWK